MKVINLKWFQLLGFLTALSILVYFSYSLNSEEYDTKTELFESNKDLTKENKIVQDFKKKYLFRKYINPYTIGYYYLWWQTDKEKSFSNSKSEKYLFKINKEIFGIESYVTLNLMRALEVVKEDEKDFKFLEEQNPYYLTFETFGKKVILLTIDKDFGLSFHFRKEDGENARNSFLVDFYEYIIAIKTMVNATNQPLDKKPSRSLEQLKAIIKTNDNPEALDKLGIIVSSKDAKDEDKDDK